ncbi:MAG: acyloxyacyl hydrolase [Bacteroidales bacterium]|nr:acyloxyacyl hydrolase [Bacteroidales bacterium]
MPAFVTILSLHAVASNNDSIFAKGFWTNIQVSVRGDYGFFVHHHLEMTRFGKHFPAFEVALQKKTYGNDVWQSYFNYPTFGVAAFYSPLGNTDIIGQSVAVYPFITFHFLKSEKNQLNFRFGGGLGYLTKKYDRYDNYQNTSIGSHITAAFNISLEYGRVIAKRYTIGLHVGLVHFSNGSTRVPNNGLNLITAGISATYLLQDEPEKNIPRPEKIGHPYSGWKKDLWSYYLSMQISAKDIDQYRGYGRNWAVYDLSGNVMKRVSFLSKVGVGINVVYDDTDKRFLEDEGRTFNDVELIKLGIAASYEVMFGSTSVLVNIGGHVTGKRRADGVLYEKVTLKQNITKHTFGALSLTFHNFVADYIGYGIGFRIN